MVWLSRSADRERSVYERETPRGSSLLAHVPALSIDFFASDTHRRPDVHGIIHSGTFLAPTGFVRIVFLSLFCLLSHSCYGTDGSQKFKVTVPDSIALTLPSNHSVHLDYHSGSDSFPEQIWNVRSNSSIGVVVIFAVPEAFSHQESTNIKVDAGMRVHLPSGGSSPSDQSANWHVLKASDQSSIEHGDQDASVSIASDGVGTVDVGLVIRFAAPSLPEVPMGTYGTDVLCTIALP